MIFTEADDAIRKDLESLSQILQAKGHTIETAKQDSVVRRSLHQIVNHWKTLLGRKSGIWDRARSLTMLVTLVTGMVLPAGIIILSLLVWYWGRQPANFKEWIADTL